MQMESGLDTGPVFAEARTAIDPRETSGELLVRLAHLGASLLTCDRGILDYARRTPGVPVCDGRG